MKLIDIIKKIYYNVLDILIGGMIIMNYYKEIFALADKLAHQEPMEGFEELYLDRASRMREIVNEARFISEYESSDCNSEKMQKLFKEAETLV